MTSAPSRAPSRESAEPVEGEPEREVRDAIAQGQRFEYAGDVERARTAYGTALALAETPALQAEAVRRLGDTHRARGAWDEARRAYARSAAIADAAGLRDLLAEALNAEGSVAVLQGDAEQAGRVFERALRENPGPRVRGLLLQNIGMCAVRERDHARAVELFVASLGCFRESGYRRGIIIALNNLGAARIEVGEPTAAVPLLREAASIARELHELDLLLLTVRNEAEVCLKLGRLEEAEQYIGEALGHFSRAGNESRRAECLVILGDVQRAHGTAALDAVAARCYTLAAELADSVGAGLIAARARTALASLTGPTG
ncbi:MAG: tetratricopeptide repeat protein [Gemmatirosa sp.]